MQVFTYSEARQNLAKLLDLAQDEEIEIRRRDGAVFSLTAKRPRSGSPSDVPGIRSAVAVPALAGGPLTSREVARSFAIVTGHCADGRNTNWALARTVDTLVILMGVSGRVKIARQLMQEGRSANTPCAFVENGATSRQRSVISTLGEVADGRVAVNSPAVWVVGDVVSLRMGKSTEAVETLAEAFPELPVPLPLV
jgi:uroporphyrin-III C-methyltransferase